MGVAGMLADTVLLAQQTNVYDGAINGAIRGAVIGGVLGLLLWVVMRLVKWFAPPADDRPTDPRPKE